jgi:hypothetical protein
MPLLKIIEKKKAITRAQEQLQQRFTAQASRINEVAVTHQGGTAREPGMWFSRPSLWAVLSDTDGRWWNAFGLQFPFDETQNIDAEINPPFEGINRRTGGAFAVDGDGAIHLMHRGALVHLKGFSKEAFLDYYGRDRLIEVDDGGHPADLILVGALDSPTLVDEVAEFVRIASEFKEALRESGVSPTSRDQPRPPWSNSFDHEADEDTRRKPLPGVVVRRVHGRVLNELARVVAEKGHTVMNDKARDLCVVDTAGRLRILFELKTANERADVYTAIGQLLFNGTEPCERVAVLPVGTDEAIARRLASLDIRLVQWEMGHDGIAFHGLDRVLGTAP